MIKVGILIPTRGDRKVFLDNALRMISQQTVTPAVIEVVDDPPVSSKVDLAWRYRLGYDRLCKKGVDIIHFWEDDDWYHRRFLEVMIKAWHDLGRPNMVGLKSTVYYHLKLRKWARWDEMKRACAFHTLLIPGLNLNVCPDYAIDFDRKVWYANGGITFEPPFPICMGIKHGDGMTAGFGHRKTWTLYKKNSDPDMRYFDSVVTDIESQNFYKSIAKQLR